MLHEKGLSTPIPATRLSDGTIHFIALVAILLKPELATPICIEEPKLGMHPDALAVIAGLLREASSTTQIVVTTHSDVLLSALSDSADSVLVCENVHGSSELRRLDTGPLTIGGKELALTSPEIVQDDNGSWITTKDYGRIKIASGALGRGSVIYLKPSQKASLMKLYQTTKSSK